MKVLIIEDNANDYLVMAQLLSMEGIEVKSKYSGINIVSFLEKHCDVDLIIMDVHLPIVDGPTALQRLQDSAAQKRIHVVAVTADAGPEQMRKAQRLGFDSFIAKPRNAERFAEQIQSILSGIPVWEAGR